MKKSFLTFVFLMGLISIVATSCSKDSDDFKEPEELSGTYQLFMNEVLIKEGTSNEVGKNGKIATMTNGDEIGIVASEIPLIVGEELSIDGSDRVVTMTGKNLIQNSGEYELYISYTGTIKRESLSKISFKGSCQDMLLNKHTFSGYIESEAYKTIQ